MIALVAVWGIGEALFGPAFGALVPDIVPSDQIVQANSLDMLMRPLGAQLAGPALGGLMIDTIGLGAAFMVDAASFAVSAVCLLAMSSRPIVRTTTEPPSYLGEIGEGFRFVRSQTWLWGSLVAASGFLLVFYGPWEVLVPFVVKNDLDGSAGDVGLVYAAAGLGAIIAALFMGQRSLPRRHITAMYASWITGALLLSAYGLATNVWQAMLAGLFRGMASTCGMIIWMSLMQTRVPRHLLGRVTAVDWFMSIGLVPISFALTGPIAESIGAQETLIAAGILGAALTAPFLFLPGHARHRAGGRQGLAGPSVTAYDRAVTVRAAPDPHHPGVVALGDALRSAGYTADKVTELLGDDAYEGRADAIPVLARLLPDARSTRARRSPALRRLPGRGRLARRSAPLRLARRPRRYRRRARRGRRGCAPRSNRPARGALSRLRPALHAR